MASLTPTELRGLLEPFGALHPQPPEDWSGEGPLHPLLARLYAEAGPWGEDTPQGPSGLTIPTTGNPFWLPPLRRLWDLQAGYRWNGHTGARLTDWRGEWLVIAAQGGDPFILDTGTGAVLHDVHGGAWSPVPLFPDPLVMAACLGTIGAVHEAAGDDIYDADFSVKPAHRATLRALLVPLLGAEGAAAAADRLDW